MSAAYVAAAVAGLVLPLEMLAKFFARRSRRIGGITFVRLGRVQFSYCVVRRKRLDK